jgi:uncharacterized protein (DUF2267 family)
MTTPSFYEAVMRVSGDADARSVRRASAAVLRALRDRLTPDEAAQVAAQLPEELKKVWWEGEASGRRPLKLIRDEFFERVRGDVDLTSKEEARWLTLGVFAALKAQLSRGEAEDVLAQLPNDLKEVWVEAEIRV